MVQYAYTFHTISRRLRVQKSKLQVIFRTFFRIQLKPLPRKSLQIFGVFNAVLNDEACHFSSAHLGIYNDCFQLPAFPHLEFGSDDAYFLLHPLPIEQVLHFAACQIDEYASLLLDFRDEIIGQQRLPIIEHGDSSLLRQAYIPFKAVRLDTIQRAKQTVKK